MIEILLRVSKIPDGSIVTKVTGEKQYTLKREIRIYGDGEFRSIKADLDTAFLVAADTINAVPGDMNLKVVMTKEEAIELLEGMQ